MTWVKLNNNIYRIKWIVYLYRLLVCYYPLLMKSVKLKSFASFHLLVTLFLSGFALFVVLWQYDLVVIPDQVHEERCAPQTKIGVLGVIMDIVLQQILFSLHTLLNILLNVIILAKLCFSNSFSLSTSRRSSTSFQNNGHSSLELRTTLVVLILSISHSVVYLPCAISWSFFGYYSNIEVKSQYEQNMYYHFTNLAHTFLLLTGSVRFINLLLLLTIPSFRKTLYYLFCKVANDCRESLREASSQM